MYVLKIGGLLEDVFCAVTGKEYFVRLIEYEEETDFEWWVMKMDTSKINMIGSYVYILK